MNTYIATIIATVETMSLFQKIGASIFLAMVLTFFAWIFYLVVSK